MRTLGENEVAEGMVRMAVSEAAAERSAELSMASDELAIQGLDELETAALAREVAAGAAAAGVGKIAEGAEAMGAGEAIEAAGEALAESDDRIGRLDDVQTMIRERTRTSGADRFEYR